MKSFYKLNGTTAEIGSGSIIPEGYIEYVVGSEPVELQDALALQAQVDAQAEAKRVALQALDSITVTTASGKVFDGRDKDQVRMLSAIQASTLLGQTSAQWKLADNSIATVTLDELREAHALAIQAVGTIILGGN